MAVVNPFEEFVKEDGTGAASAAGDAGAMPSMTPSDAGVASSVGASGGGVSGAIAGASANAADSVSGAAAVSGTASAPATNGFVAQLKAAASNSITQLKNEVSKALPLDQLQNEKIVELKAAIKEEGLVKGVSSQVKNMVSEKVDSFLGAGSESLSFLAKAGGSFLNTLKDNVIGALVSRIFIPEEVYLAGLMALNVIKSDISYRNNYIRSLAIKRDLSLVVEFCDKEIGITYSYSKTTGVNEARNAAKFGAIHVVRYMMRQMKDEVTQMVNIRVPAIGDSPGYPEDKKEAAKLDNEIQKAKDAFHSITKQMIVGSYTHLDVSFLNSVFTEFNIHASAFGFKDREFNGKHKFSTEDINKMAPFYKPKKIKKSVATKKDKNGNITYWVNKEEVTKEDYDYAVAQNNSSGSFLADTQSITSTKLVPNKSDKLQFISPRNFNIKKIYLYLVSGTIHKGASDVFNFAPSPGIATQYKDIVDKATAKDQPRQKEFNMFHEPFYERMKFPIYSTMIAALDSAMSGFYNVGLGKQYTDAIASIDSAMYDYTRGIEKYLNDPSKTQFIAINDFIELPEPEAPPDPPKTRPDAPKKETPTTRPPVPGVTTTEPPIVINDGQSNLDKDIDDPELLQEMMGDLLGTTPKIQVWGIAFDQTKYQEGQEDQYGLFQVPQRPDDPSYHIGKYQYNYRYPEELEERDKFNFVRDQLLINTVKSINGRP
jgi:hypothetical protein